MAAARFYRESGVLPSRRLDKNSPHRLGGRGEEMGAIGKHAGTEAKPGLMDERGGLQGMSRLFPRHLGRCQASQFGIDEREQFMRGTQFTALDGLKNASDFAHAPRR